ncbi:hypothetical protein ACM66B_006608 [Microbotryomycetes sp. NB124-2]
MASTQTQAQAQQPVTKRKIQDVMSALDSGLSLSYSSHEPRQSSSKRKRRHHDSALGMSTPLLVSLLPARQTQPPVAATPPSYNPSSLPQLVDRISTFKLTTFTAPKPRSLSAAACAMLGWQSVSPGRDRIQCVTCQATMVVECGQSGWSSTTGTRLRTELEQQLRTRHKDTCPWRLRACAPGLYKVPLGHRTKELEAVRTRVRNLASLRGIRVAVADDSLSTTHRDQLVTLLKSTSTADEDADVSSDVVVLALLGWDMFADSASAASLKTISCQWCCRRVLASSYVQQDPPAGASKSFDAVNQHQSFCPVIDPHAGHWSLSSTDASASDDNAVAPTSHVPAWQQRLDVLLQRDAQRRTSFDLLTKLNDENGETTAETQRNKTRAIVSYVRNMLGATTKYDDRQRQA